MSELDAISIPDKTYFKIGEVAKLLDLEPYVLRYWESEFDILAPDKTDSGQRIYQRADIELVCHIRNLLYDEMFTIAGARRQLELEREGKPCYANADKARADDDGMREQVEQLELTNAQLQADKEDLAAEKARIEADRAKLEASTDKLKANRDALEADKAQLGETIAALTAELDAERQQANAQPDMWEERVASQSEHIDELERQLAQADQTIAELRQRSTPPGVGVDPKLLKGLRQQIEGLARLAQQRPV